jgi:hypothetical protein
MRMKQTHSRAITGANNAVAKELTALRQWRLRIAQKQRATVIRQFMRQYPGHTKASVAEFCDYLLGPVR